MDYYPRLRKGYHYKKRGLNKANKNGLKSRVILNLLAFLVMSARAILRGFYLVFYFTGKTITPAVWRFFWRFALLPGYRHFTYLRLHLKKWTKNLIPALEKLSVEEGTLWFIAFAVIAIGVSINNLYERSVRPEDIGRKSIFFKITTPEGDSGQEMITEGAPLLHSKIDPEKLTLSQPVPNQDITPLKSKPIIPQQKETGTQDISLNQPIIMDYSTQHPVSPAETETRSNIETYTVQEGDTLGEIADRFNISLNTVLWANNLKERSILRLGQTLTILPVSGVIHTARQGDTLARIARLYQVDAQDIALVNNLSLTDIIRPKDQLIIPDGKPLNTVQPQRTSIARLRDLLFTPSEPRTRLLKWPTTSRRVTQPFRGWRHTGIDIGNDFGEPVYAAGSGIIQTAGWNRGGYGLYIVVRHANGMMTLYGHNSKIFVTVGQSVTQGQVIALIGSTGRSTGPHLHFEVRSEGNFRNPLNYF